MIVERAIALAARWHTGQRDRLGQPYVFHPLRVMLAMATPETQAAAALHDVLEDSACTLDDLRRERFPEAVVDLVDLLTHRPDQTYDAYLARLAASPAARALKLADLRDNIAVREHVVPTPEDREKLARYRRALQYLGAEVPAWLAAMPV